MKLPIFGMLSALVVAMFLAGCGEVTAGVVESRLNKKVLKGRALTRLLDKCGADCQTIREFFIVDLHADSFLWGRDPRVASRTGHVDLPRLRAAGVDLQVFSVPSKTPLGRGRFDKGPRGNDPRFYDGNTEHRNVGGLKCTDVENDRDTTRLLYQVSLRKSGTAKIIAMNQARRFCEASEGAWDRRSAECSYASSRKPNTENFFAIRNRDDLTALIDAIDATPPGADKPVGALLSIEGVHWIPEDASVETVRDEIKALERAGFRMIALTHKFTNGLGGSDEDCGPPTGLTPAGIKAVKAIFDAGLILDVAHLSAKGIWDADSEVVTALSLADLPAYGSKRRMVMSHGAIRTEACQNYRNLEDDHVRKLLAEGVPFGMIHWDAAYCLGGDVLRSQPKRTRAKAIEDAIIGAYRRMIAAEGTTPEQRRQALAALAMGADLDGAVRAPYDVTGFPHLLWRLSQEPWCGGLSNPVCAAAIRDIAGGNVLRMLKEAL